MHLQRMPGAWSPGMRLCAATRVKSLATADPPFHLFQNRRRFFDGLINEEVFAGFGFDESYRACEITIRQPLVVFVRIAKVYVALPSPPLRRCCRRGGVLHL